MTLDGTALIAGWPPVGLGIHDGCISGRAWVCGHGIAGL